MRNAHLLGFKDDGSATIISGPDQPLTSQRDFMRGLTNGDVDLPKGIVGVELHVSDTGRALRFGKTSVTREACVKTPPNPASKAAPKPARPEKQAEIRWPEGKVKAGDNRTIGSAGAGPLKIEPATPPELPSKSKSDK
jgi:hypothetical protein